MVELVRVLFLGGPLEEELGWRGFLLPRLQAARSAWSASLLLGLDLGSVAHPLYFVSGTGQSEIAASTGVVFAITAFVIWTIGLDPLHVAVQRDRWQPDRGHPLSRLGEPRRVRALGGRIHGRGVLPVP